MVTSFLFGRRRRGFEDDDLVTLDMSSECLMRRLSFFEVENAEEDWDECGAWVVILRADFKGFAPRLGRARRGAYIGYQPARRRRVIFD